MNVTIIYFVHGSTEDKENDIFTGILPGKLSTRGHIEAKELGEKFNSQLDILFTSDLSRATETARIAFGEKFPITIDMRLREVNAGSFNGKLYSFKDNLEDYIEQPFPGGESLKDVEKRLVSFVSDLQKSYQGKIVGVLSHHAPQLALDVIANNVSWKVAISSDWRRTSSWQPGWKYYV